MTAQQINRLLLRNPADEQTSLGWISEINWFGVGIALVVISFLLYWVRRILRRYRRREPESTETAIWALSGIHYTNRILSKYGRSMKQGRTATIARKLATPLVDSSHTTNPELDIIPTQPLYETTDTP